jgi:hypothetical protein
MSAWSQEQVFLPDLSALLPDMSAWSTGACAANWTCLYDLYRSLCCYYTCLHRRQEHVLLPDMSAWSTGACTATRHLCMVSRLWRSQKCLHGLQDPVMLPGMSAWSKAVCTVPRHVCIIYTSLCCYQTCLLGLQEPAMLPDMSARSTGTCSAPRHSCMCMVCRSILLILHVHIVQENQGYIGLDGLTLPLCLFKYHHHHHMMEVMMMMMFKCCILLLGWWCLHLDTRCNTVGWPKIKDPFTHVPGLGGSTRCKRALSSSILSADLKSWNQKSKSWAWSLCSVSELLRLWNFVSFQFLVSWREGTARTHHIFGHSAAGSQKVPFSEC